jgi:hypothetical protein
MPREYVTYAAKTPDPALHTRLLVGKPSLTVISQPDRTASTALFYLAFMFMAKLLMVNFSSLLFVDTSSTPWQIW